MQAVPVLLHSAAEVSPGVAVYMPLLHSVGAVAPAGQNAPGGQVVHVSLLAAPTAALKLPAAHSVALTELWGQ